MNITSFINALTDRLNEHKKASGLTYFETYRVEATEGKKYFKIYKTEMLHNGHPFSHRSLVAFVDKTTGDIFKPASFAAPAKHSRGNVLSAQNGMEAISPDGFVYYLRG